MLKVLHKESESPTDGVRHGIRYVTPEMAKKWLENNYHRQRPLSTRGVDKLASAMLNNKWMFDGAPIRFDETGMLIDGQHRLSALIKADVELPFLVVSGLNEMTYLVMDNGIKRDSRATMHSDGYVHIKNELARLTRLMVASEYGRKSYKQTVNSAAIQSVDNQDIHAAIELHPECIEYAEKYRSKAHMNTRKFLGAGDAAYINWVLDRISKTDADAFFRKLETGEGMTSNDPVLMLRNKMLIDSSLSRNIQHVKIIKIAYLIKAWNAMRAGKELKLLRQRDDEAFPVPV